MGLRGILSSNPSFSFEKNIFYEKYTPQNAFEKKYIKLRKLENRVYSDEVVRGLPEFDAPGSLRSEWLLRKITLKNLIKYFGKKDNNGLILELGCGNGWLSHRLAIALNAEILGIDVNETELWQGAALFKDCENLSFMYADVFSADFKKETFDIILLASSVQYFSDLKRLIQRLLKLLSPSGEILIVDSPIYNSSSESQEAKKRSHDYFISLGAPEMADNYFHHTLIDLNSFNYEVLFRTNSLISIIKRKILRMPQNIYPWILIKHP